MKEKNKKQKKQEESCWNGSVVMVSV